MGSLPLVVLGWQSFRRDLDYATGGSRHEYFGDARRGRAPRAAFEARSRSGHPGSRRGHGSDSARPGASPDTHLQKRYRRAQPIQQCQPGGRLRDPARPQVHAERQGPTQLVSVAGDDGVGRHHHFRWTGDEASAQQKGAHRNHPNGDRRLERAGGDLHGGERSQRFDSAVHRQPHQSSTLESLLQRAAASAAVPTRQPLRSRDAGPHEQLLPASPAFLDREPHEPARTRPVRHRAARPSPLATGQPVQSRRTPPCRE